MPHTASLVAQARFDDLVEALNAVVWEADGDDYHMTFVSPRASDITGYSADVWMNEPEFWENRLHPDDRDATIAAVDTAIGAMRDVSIEYRFRTADGSYRWFSDVIRVIPKRDGSGHRLVGVMLDITRQKRLEAELAYRASHDALTDLLNREQLDVELARVHELPGRWAMLFLDLDDFKAVNDGLGHTVGDDVLRVVAQRLRNGVRERDLVARFGGDEFGILAPVVTEDDARVLATRLRDHVRRSVVSGGRRLRVGASVGIAFVEPGRPPDVVLRRADAAMYWAKQNACGIALYEPWMHEDALRRLGTVLPAPTDGSATAIQA